MKKVPSIRKAMSKTHKASKFLLVTVLLSICFSALDKIFTDNEWLEITDLALDIITWIAVFVYLIQLMKQIDLTSAMAGAIQEIIQEYYE